MPIYGLKCIALDAPQLEVANVFKSLPALLVLKA
jgi:hypothetical protein